MEHPTLTYSHLGLTPHGKYILHVLSLRSHVLYPLKSILQLAFHLSLRLVTLLRLMDCLFHLLLIMMLLSASLVLVLLRPLVHLLPQMERLSLMCNHLGLTPHGKYILHVLSLSQYEQYLLKSIPLQLFHLSLRLVMSPPLMGYHLDLPLIILLLFVNPVLVLLRFVPYPLP